MRMKRTRAREARFSKTCAMFRYTHFIRLETNIMQNRAVLFSKVVAISVIFFLKKVPK